MKPSLRLNFLLLKMKHDPYFTDKIVLRIFYRETLRIK
jgi:hypothetical protein